MPRRSLLIGAVALALIVSVGGCRTSPAQQAGVTSPEILQSTLDNWRLRADIPAAVLGVAHSGGPTWVGASGTLEQAGSVPVTTEARFRIASITKVFVSVVVLQLVEEGKLQLDDPLSHHLPAYPAQNVTIRQLLNHTSGVPDYSMSDAFNKERLNHRDRRWTAADVLALVKDTKPDFTPGAGYAYSNTNYVLLGEAIRNITERSWEQEVRRRILDPLNLDSTHIAGSERVPEPVIPGYFDADNDGHVENIETGKPWPALETSEGPAGAIISTAPDLLAFGEALYRGDLIQEPTLERWSPKADTTRASQTMASDWRSDGPTIAPRSGGTAVSCPASSRRSGTYHPATRSSWYLPTTHAPILLTWQNS
jgi:D-alanyl-D-alanine carboxypeptidase